MEINHFEEVMGVLPVADVVEGRMVLLTSHTHDYDFGSQKDLPGVKVPATAEEANMAKFCVTWQVSNSPAPYYSTIPHYDFSLRQGGWDQSANVPFSATVRLTYPGYQESQTIPSGVPSLAFGEGTYTVPSGCYINHNSLVNPGTLLQVANTAEDTTDAGKLKYIATYGNRVVAVVEHYNLTNGDLTFRIIR